MGFIFGNNHATLQNLDYANANHGPSFAGTGVANTFTADQTFGTAGTPVSIAVKNTFGTSVITAAGSTGILTATTVNASTLIGSGANISALNASNIASGTLADGRLSGNVPLLNAANVFTANQEIDGALQVGNTGTSGSIAVKNSSATNVFTVSTSGAVAGFSFAGTGSNLLQLNASNISSGTLSLTRGGTGQTSANNAFNALAPSQTGNSGKVLSTDGTNTSWATASSGTVTTVSVTTANGVSGSVANPTTTPAITLSLGAISPTSVAASGAVSGSNLSGTNTGDQTITLTGDVTGSGTGSFATTLATVPIAKGGTGQTSAANAINALVPTQTGNSGKFLTTNGTAVSWGTAGGGGGTSSFGPSSSRPAAGTVGNVYYPSDGGPIWVDDGSDWACYVGGIGPFYTPVSTFTTWVNQSSALFRTTHNVAQIYWVNNGGIENVNCRVATIPATPWTYTLVFSVLAGPGNNGNFGLILRESSSGKLQSGPGFNPQNSAPTVNYWNWSSPTAYNNNLATDATYTQYTQLIMCRVRNDGTNYYFELSNDFINWTLNLTVPVASAYGAFDQAGYYINVSNLHSGETQGLTVYHSKFS